MSATEVQEISFPTAMVKAAVQIVCEEKGLDTPKDIDELAKFIVVEKDLNYGYWNICRKDHLPFIISDFLGEAVWAKKITENDDDDTAKVLVKIKDNVWQVDFKDFCKNGAADLSVEKLEKCKDTIDNKIESFVITEKVKIGNILKDFEDYKKREEQEAENMKKDNNMVQTPTHILNKNLPQTPKPKKRHSFLDCLFGRWPREYYDVNDRNVISEKGADYTKFHACTQPALSFHK